MTLPPSDPVLLRAAAEDPARAVERAVSGLDGLPDRPLAEHVAVFERIHVALGEALAAGEAAGRP